MSDFNGKNSISEFWEEYVDKIQKRYKLTREKAIPFAISQAHRSWRTGTHATRMRVDFEAKALVELDKKYKDLIKNKDEVYKIHNMLDHYIHTNYKSKSHKSKSYKKKVDKKNKTRKHR